MTVFYQYDGGKMTDASHLPSLYILACSPCKAFDTSGNINKAYLSFLRSKKSNTAEAEITITEIVALFFSTAAVWEYS